MATYLGKFAPNLSDVTALLRDLTKKENAFSWDAVGEKAYNNMKQLLCKEPGPVLAYFDPHKDVVLQCDASQKGLGAALLQEQHPISYASRCMTSAEHNYRQIVKELLAVVFACERFHQYTYGRDIAVQSDHKPLEAITNNPLACAPPRLQRMVLRLQRYNVKVVYVPGKQIPLADTLSRIFVKIEPKLPRHDLEDSVRVHETLTTSYLSEEVGVFEILHTAVSDARIEKFRAAMKHDQSMQILIRTIQSGWPNERRRCPKQIQDFWNIRDELAIVDDESSPLVIKGHRIVIPPEQREYIMQQLHIGHFGIENTKQRARKCCILPSLEHRYRVAHRKMLDMPRAPVGTTDGTHGKHTDSDETIPDGGRRSVRVRWQALSVTTRLLQPLHRSREALLNPCIIHHHEDERDHGQTRNTRTGIF